MPKIICKGAKNKGFGADAITTGMQIGGEKMAEYKMAEYIVRESGYPGTIKKEIVGEVVRCKECKWFDGSYPLGTFADGVFRCRRVRTLWMKKDAFCSYGERSDNE